MKNKMTSKTIVNKKNPIERFLINALNNLTEAVEEFRLKIGLTPAEKNKLSFDNGYKWAMEELKKGNEDLVEAMCFNPFNRIAQNRPFDQGIIQAMREFNSEKGYYNDHE